MIDRIKRMLERERIFYSIFFFQRNPANSNLIEFKRTGLSIVVTRDRIKLPALPKTIYIHRRRGGCIVSDLRSERRRPCRRSAGDLSKGEICLPAFSFPELEPPVSERNAPRNSFRNSCRAPRVGAIGPNNYHTWNEVFIVGQRSFAPRGSAPPRLLSARLFLFLADARDEDSISNVLGSTQYCLYGLVTCLYEFIRDRTFIRSSFSYFMKITPRRCVYPIIASVSPPLVTLVIQTKG